MDFYQYEWPVSCPVSNTICVYNDLGLIGVGSASPSAWNLYYAGGSVEIDGRKTKSNQLIGQVVYRNGWTSGLDAGTISAKPSYVTMASADCAPGYTCRNYNPIEVDLDSDHGDSGAGFYRVQSDGFGGYNNNGYGILSFGKPGYTYYYAWDQPFYADWNFTDERTVYPCITADCPL